MKRSTFSKTFQALDDQSSANLISSSGKANRILLLDIRRTELNMPALIFASYLFPNDMTDFLNSRDRDQLVCRIDMWEAACK
jgi:hypothetical protein